MKKYLSLLFLALTALYCPEGETFLGDFLSGTDRTRYEQLDGKPEAELSDNEADELLELTVKAVTQQQHQAELAGKDVELVTLQNKQEQVEIENKLLVKEPNQLTAEDIAFIMANYQEGSPLYEKALEANENSNTGTDSGATSPVTQVIDPLAQASQPDASALDYAKKMDDLLLQYDGIIQRIAEATQKDVTTVDRYFRAAQALADGIQDALKALDKYVNGKDGQTYRDMLDSVRVSGDPSFEKKAERTMKQINLTLDTLRAMGFSDVSQMVPKIGTSLEVKDFRYVASKIFGLTDGGEIDTKIDLGTTDSAKDFRNFGVEIFSKAENPTELQAVLAEWRSKIFDDLYASMEVLQDAKTMPNISVIAEVLRPILETEITAIWDDMDKNLPEEADGELVHALYMWKAKQTLDPMFILYGWVAGTDSQILEDQKTIQGFSSDIDSVMNHYFLNGNSSVVQAVYNEAVSLAKQADRLDTEEINKRKNAILSKYKMTEKELASWPLLKELIDYELSDKGGSFWPFDAHDSFEQTFSEEDRKSYLESLQEQSQVLKNVADIMQQLSAAALVSPDVRAALGKELGDMKLLLANKMPGNPDQVISNQDQARELTQKLEWWEMLSEGYEGQIAGLKGTVLSDGSKTQIDAFKNQLSEFDSSLQQVQTLVARALQTKNVTAESVKASTLAQMKMVTDSLAPLVGKDPALQEIARSLSDRMINTKEDVSQLDVATTLHQLLAQYDAEPDAVKKEQLEKIIKQVYAGQNALYGALYDANQNVRDLREALNGYIGISADLKPEDFPLLEMPVTDPSTSEYSASAMAQFGTNAMGYVSPAKLLLPENKAALIELGKQLLLSGDSWQAVEGNFALDPYDAFVAQRNFDALGLHGDTINWSNVAPSILSEVGEIWLKPLADKDPKSLTPQQLQRIADSFYQVAQQGSQESTMYKSLSGVVSSQASLDAFLHQCGLGGRDVLVSKDEAAAQGVLTGTSQAEFDLDTYKAWLDVVIGNDRQRAQKLIAGN